MRTRRLTLQRETLAALTDDDLALVAGAAAAAVPDHTLDRRCIEEFIDRNIGQSGGC